MGLAPAYLREDSMSNSELLALRDEAVVVTEM